MQPDTTDEDNQQQLPQDGPTPFQPADDTTQGAPADDTHPTTDTGVDSQQQYDEGVTGADNTTEPQTPAPAPDPGPEPGTQPPTSPPDVPGTPPPPPPAG
jgi:hypothetical protein